jgi:hypothetical protein
LPNSRRRELHQLLRSRHKVRLSPDAPPIFFLNQI